MKKNTEFWLRVWEETKAQLRGGETGDLGRSKRNKSLRLAFIEDQAEASELLQLSKKKYYTPHLSQDYNDLHAKNAFWAFLIDDEALSPEDRVPGVIGARLDEIPDGGLPDFWYNHYRRLKDTDFGGILDPARQPHQARAISGKVVYIGDYFQDPRGHIDHHAFMLSVFTMAQIKWSPDFIYGFITEDHANKGQSYRLGFQHHCRSVHRWIEPPAKRHDTDLLIYNTHEDVVDVAELFLQRRQGIPKPLEKIVPLKAQNAKGRDS